MTLFGGTCSEEAGGSGRDASTIHRDRVWQGAGGACPSGATASGASPLSIAAAWAAAPSATSSSASGTWTARPDSRATTVRHTRPRAPPPISTSGASGSRPGADPAEQLERLDQRGDRALVGGQQDLPRLGRRGAAPRSCRGGGQVGRALAVEVGEHRTDVGSAHGLALEPEPAGHPVHGERAVERRRQRQEPPVASANPAIEAARVDRPLGHRRVGRARGAEADRRLARPQAETQRGAHVVAGAGPDRAPRAGRAARPPPAHLAGRLAGPSTSGSSERSSSASSSTSSR